ncbi:MAG: FAD:protein FMN transferase, partial [Acidimicrobiales bacterium]
LDGVMVNAGGDVACLGTPAPGEAFRVGIVRPDSRLELATIVDVAGAVATSGTYERGEHLVNPFSGHLASAVASATVTGPDLGMADALATALCVAGPTMLELLGDIDGYEGFTIGHDGARGATERFPFARRVGAVADAEADADA